MRQLPQFVLVGRNLITAAHGVNHFSMLQLRCVDAALSHRITTIE
jgi:hypothetical protein